jgi:hypothetical protein
MEMVANLEKAFGSRIDSLSWMSPETKKRGRRNSRRSGSEWDIRTMDRLLIVGDNPG